MKTAILMFVLLSALLFGGCATPAEKQAKLERKHQKEAGEQQRREQDNLRRKFAKYTTGELKLMYAGYGGLVERPGTHDLELAPLATKLWGTSDRQNVDKLLHVERELLRRWKAGDQEAKLPKFDAVLPAK